MKRTTIGLAAVIAACALNAWSAAAIDAVTPSTITAEATFASIGVRWAVADDDDLDATCTARYRELGAPAWHDALDLVRTHPGLLLARSDDRFAGSVFHLAPGTTYEIELTLFDPDGGGTTQVVSATTETPLETAATPSEVWVAPGSGGGTGTQVDPFLGLQEAADNAVPGALFHVAAGSYTSFSLASSGTPGSPIVFRGPVNPNLSSNEARWAIVDGAGTIGSVVTLGTSSVISHVIIESLAIQNGSFGVNAKRATDVAFRRNRVRNVDTGYLSIGLDQALRHEISDNIFVGREAWPGAMAGGAGAAISVGGSAHTVAHNRVMFFGDGIAVSPSTLAADGSDVYGNDVNFIVDDAISLDESNANVRVWRNRISNAGTGISLDLVYGGPVYVFRNELFNVFWSPFQMNFEPSGMLLLHNTTVKLGNGILFGSGSRRNLLSRNNFALGTFYAIEAAIAGGIEDWDYDGLGTSDASRFARWAGVRLDDLSTFAGNTGLELNGVETAFSDLADPALPAMYSDGATSGSWDLRPLASSPSIDAGVTLANVNEPYVSDGLPDLGAFEFGAAAPQYGPRVSAPAVPALSLVALVALTMILFLYTNIDRLMKHR